MRRRYSQKKQSPTKEFIHTFHVNQVPLPYYNPLADPYLKGFFSNSRNVKHIDRQGFVYSPEKEYPYDERRLTNFNKFLKNNSHITPTSHVKNRSVQFRLRGKSSSYADLLNEEETTKSEFFIKRMSDSNLSRKKGIKINFLQEERAESPRPPATTSPKRSFSMDGKRNKDYIFRRSPIRRRPQELSQDLIL